MLNQKGQSLIEVLVVGTVAAAMIIALIIIILNSLKNAQFAQSQTQATNLAQDTIDKIRVLRDNNKINTIQYGSTFYCFNELWGNSRGDYLYCGGTGSYCFYTLDDSVNILNKVAENLSTVTVTNGFSRQIKVSQPSADQADLIVSIIWQDSTGSHSSDLETIITKPNYGCVQN